EFRRKRKAEPMTLAILQGYVANQGDAWQHTLDVLSSFYERALAARDGENREPPSETATALDLAIVEATARAQEMIDTYLQTARLLARRTAEMHLALASPTDDPAFRPEPMTPLYQRGRYQSLRNLTNHIFLQLRQHQNDIPKADRKFARRLLDIEDRVFERI